MASMSVLIAFDQVSYSLNERRIIDNVSFTVQSKDVVTIVGPNGSGKSTLIRLLLGLVKPQTGTLQRTHERSVGYVPQNIYLPAHLPLTAIGFLSMFTSPTEGTEALAELNIQHIAHSPIAQLSVGERQLLLVARAIMRRPQLLVLDEPAAGLDLNHQLFLYDFLVSFRTRYSATIVIVSHDLHIVMAHTDKVICLHAGHICCQGSMKTVLSDPVYRSLFGTAASETLAIYPHHHTH